MLRKKMYKLEEIKKNKTKKNSDGVKNKYPNS